MRDGRHGRLKLLTFALSSDEFLHFSPIHDHAGSHCVMKILDGNLTETLFEWPAMTEQENAEPADDESCDITSARKHDCCPKTGVCLTKQRETVYGADQVTYVHGMSSGVSNMLAPLGLLTDVLFEQIKSVSIVLPILVMSEALCLFTYIHPPTKLARRLKNKLAELAAVESALSTAYEVVVPFRLMGAYCLRPM